MSFNKYYVQYLIESYEISYMDILKLGTFPSYVRKLDLDFRQNEVFMRTG